MRLGHVNAIETTEGTGANATGPEMVPKVKKVGDEGKEEKFRETKPSSAARDKVRSRGRQIRRRPRRTLILESNANARSVAAMELPWRLIPILAVIAALGSGTRAQQDRFAGKHTLRQLYSELRTMTSELWYNINDARWHANLAFGRNPVPADEKILRYFARFSEALERNGLDSNLRRLRQRLLTGTLGSMDSWANADANVGFVDAVYLGFRIFQERFPLRFGSDTSRLAFTDLAQTILQEERDDSIQSSLFKLHELLTEGSDALFRNLPAELTHGDGQGLCATRESPQQLIQNVYNIALLTDIKGYAMMQFSWMILSLYDHGNFTRAAKGMDNRIEQILLEKTETAKQAISLASQEYWNCDPHKHQENVTYVQLTNLIQGHIQNEIDINPTHNCREECSHYSGDTFAEVTSCYQGLFCDVQPKCTGRLIGCRFIDSDSQVCLSGPNVTNRKYDWIAYENGRTLGKRRSCPTEVAAVDSWWSWVVWHCSYCFCLCDQPGPMSDRYFSLRTVLARGVDSNHLGSNRVVTGLRFVKVNRVIHLQIQDGIALPGGLVNSSTVQWQPITPFKIDDPNITKGVDYHVMSWEKRAIDLDDLAGPPGQVLTGVRLRLLGVHLNLEILTTPYDSKTGKLGGMDDSGWMSNDNTPAAEQNHRTEVKIINPGVPTSCPRPSHVTSRSGQFIKFTHSDLDKDVAQTTVPFIDSQPVTPDPPTLLAGAGLFYKGSVGCGGFVAPKVLTYDYSQSNTENIR
ncbi:uncharacterized protein LOC124158778 [Ischnura elegans]|uniref:uncharacterized protein LOC124158778 n=1 Tax=Ischnura elegans TaxID=197161 RepID=UPI001ED88ACB|nr:uncharacterized protein LOC124158778 [Ischnura elegans]